MNTHSIDLIRYCAKSRGNSTIYLGTAGSHGNEQLQVTQGKGWEGLTVQVVFHPCKVAVQLPANGVLDVPWEATARPLTAMQGRIVFQGFDQDRLVNSTDLAYTVASHSPTLGRDEQPYTPGIVEGVLNQMAADKDAILQAAQQTGQAKEAAATSAAEAASSAANAQQSAGAANTSAGQAAASASQAAGSAAAANETLTQVQTAGQEAQQKVKDAETEALGNISAAAPALPAVSAAAAWQSVTAKPDGTGYNLASMAPIEATIRPTVTGNPAVCKDSAAWGLQGLKIYGKSIQDGTPNPENPVPIVSAGDGGKVEIVVNGMNLFDSSELKPGYWQDGKYESTNSPIFRTAEIEIIKSGDYTWSFGEDLRIVRNDTEIPNRDCSTFTVSYATGKHYLSFRKTDNSNWDNGVNIMFNIGSNALPWEPYMSQSLTISIPNGLPGIPVDSGGNFTDADGQQLVCDVKDYGTGKYTQNCVKVVLDGSSDENWVASNTDNVASKGYRFLLSGQASAKPVDVGSTIANLICNRFDAVSNFNTYAGVEGVSIGTGTAPIHFYCTSVNDSVESWRTWLSTHPVELIYILNSPIENDIPAEELAAYRALTTYDGATVVSTAEPVAGIEARYVMDGNKYRESVDKRLAALEAAQTGI